MPRSQPSPMDQELLRAAAAAGWEVSPYQLERWRALGLVPHNERRGLGRGRGTVSIAPQDALPRLIAAAKSVRQGRVSEPDAVFARLVSGLPVSDNALRSAVAKHLRRLDRHFMLSDNSDEGWQKRYERARREPHSTGRPLKLDMLMPGGADNVLAEDEDVDWREVMVTYAQAMTGDVNGVTSEELARAMAVLAADLTEAEVDQLVAEVRAAEMAGHDLAAVVVPLMSVPRLVAAVATVDVDTLRRAVATVCTVQGLHALLLLQGMHELVRREVGPTELDTLLPESCRRLPDGAARLRAHPAWRWFSSPPVRLFSVHVALTSMLLTGEPTMLSAVEDYRDQLVAVMGLAPRPEPLERQRRARR